MPLRSGIESGFTKHFDSTEFRHENRLAAAAHGACTHSSRGVRHEHCGFTEAGLERRYRVSTEEGPVWLRQRSGPIIATGIVLTLLYVGRAVLIPLALAIMLSFLVAPLVRALRRIQLGRTSSVLVAVLALTVSCVAVAIMLGTQVLHMAESLPQYEATVQRKLKTLDDVTLGRLRVLTTEASRLTEIHDARNPTPGTDDHTGRSAPVRSPELVMFEPRDSADHGDRGPRPDLRVARV